jgi:c-di-GMP-related signal transduction protein
MEILLARQPIFNREEHLVGYELFYRGTVDAERSPRADAGETADRAILQGCLDHGLEQLAGGKPVFFRVSRHMLLDRSVRLVDPRRAVLQRRDHGTR